MIGGCIVVPEPEFRLCISAINQTVEDFFPCPPGFICGYLCCVGTLGASIFCQDPYSLEVSSELTGFACRNNLLHL